MCGIPPHDVRPFLMHAQNQKQHLFLTATVEDLRELARARAYSRSHASGQEEFDEERH